MELLALGSCLPGPTSTQMSFAIGITKQGWAGGLLSGGDLSRTTQGQTNQNLGLVSRVSPDVLCRNMQGWKGGMPSGDRLSI